MWASASKHRTDVRVTFPAVQVRGECSFGARRGGGEKRERERRSCVCCLLSLFITDNPVPRNLGHSDGTLHPGVLVRPPFVLDEDPVKTHKCKRTTLDKQRRPKSQLHSPSFSQGPTVSCASGLESYQWSATGDLSRSRRRSTSSRSRSPPGARAAQGILLVFYSASASSRMCAPRDRGHTPAVWAAGWNSSRRAGFRQRGDRRTGTCWRYGHGTQ